MNGTTLKALRLALGFTQEEAARMIGAVSMRSWRYWEDEGRTIPADVEATMRELGRFKLKLIEEASAQISQMTKKHGANDSIALTYYSTLEDWMTQDGARAIQWKPHRMAMGALAEKYETSELIEFKPVEYRQWLNGRRDDSSMLAQWAAFQK